MVKGNREIKGNLTQYVYTCFYCDLNLEWVWNTMGRQSVDVEPSVSLV